MEKITNEITERRLENLIFYHFDIQNKFVYYLLAINAACIGFTVNYTKNIQLSVNEIILGLAILFWCFSFYSGLVQIQNLEMSVQLNIKKLTAFSEKKVVPEWVEHQSTIASKKGVKYRRYQNASILMGVLLFIIWRVLKK